MLVRLFERALAGKLDSRANISLEFIAQSTIHNYRLKMLGLTDLEILD